MIYSISHYRKYSISSNNQNILNVPVHMMTASNGNIFALLAICKGSLPVSNGFPSQRPVTRSFDTKGCVNNGDAGDLRRHRAHYDVIVMHAMPVFLLKLRKDVAVLNLILHQVLRVPVRLLVISHITT